MEQVRNSFLFDDVMIFVNSRPPEKSKKVKNKPSKTWFQINTPTKRKTKRPGPSQRKQLLA